MQWQAWMDAPTPAALDITPSMVTLQDAKEPVSELDDCRQHSATAWAATNYSSPQTPANRAELYDLAELLLAELMPGWDEDDFEDEEEDEDEEQLLGLPDPVVDASYRACMLEAERYLVQCEGFDAEGSVVIGLREHLQLARIQASSSSNQNDQPGQQRYRPPGYP